MIMTKQSSQQTSQLDDAFKNGLELLIGKQDNIPILIIKKNNQQKISLCIFITQKNALKKDNRIFFSKRNTWDNRMHLLFFKNKKELATSIKKILEVSFSS